MTGSKNVYLFSGESYMVNQNIKALRKKLDIQHEQLNVSVHKEMPNADSLIFECAQVPFMAPQRLVIVRDESIFSAKSSAAEGKKIAEFLEQMPESTVLVFGSDGKPDKRRALYQQIKKLGQTKEFASPKRAEGIRFVTQLAAQRCAGIERNAAELLVNTAGCDYYTLDNEMNKLVAYASAAKITAQHVKECASRSLEYNVFEIHGLLAQKKTTEAYTLLTDIMSEERPEALIGIFARKIRDMYKTKAMVEAGFSISRVAEQLKLPAFVAEQLGKESRRFTVDELRNGLKALAELDYAIKSGTEDAALALPDTLVKIYKL